MLEPKGTGAVTRETLGILAPWPDCCFRAVLGKAGAELGVPPHPRGQRTIAPKMCLPTAPHLSAVQSCLDSSYIP